MELNCATIQSCGGIQKVVHSLLEFILKWIKGEVVDTQRDVVYAGMRDTTRKNVLTILMFLKEIDLLLYINFVV